MRWRREIRESGLLSMLAGLVLVATVFLTELVHDDMFYLVAVALLLLLLAVPGLHASQGGRDGRAGRVGAWLMAVGSAIIALIVSVVGLAALLTDFDPEEAGWAFAILVAGFLALAIGSLVFGIATARAGVLPPLAGIVLAIALPVGILIDVVGAALDAGEIGFYIGVPAFAIALAWLGYALWTRDAPNAGPRATRP